MKKIILGVSVLLMSAVGAGAQNFTVTQDKSPDAKADQLTIQMTKQFALNEDQTAEVKAINLDFFQKEVYINEKGGGYDHLKALEDNRDNELKSVMSKSQYRNYETQAKVKYNEEKAVEVAKKKDRKAGHHAKLETKDNSVVN